MKAWKRQKRLLDRIYKHYGSFKVASHTTYGYWVYFNYPSKRVNNVLESNGVTDRYILQDEIVIETDMNMRKMNRAVSEQQEKKLLKHNYSYKRWFSGNKSYHIHTIFPELMMINNDYDRKLLKSLFIKWLYGLLDDVSVELFNKRKASLIGHKVDLQLCGKHLIRLEHSQHTKTGVRKRLLSENISDTINKLPYIVWKKFVLLSAKFKSDKPIIQVKDMNCINYFLNNEVEDCRKRVAFILITNLKSRYGLKTASDIIKSWNNSVNHNHFSEGYITYITNYHACNNYTPKCKYIQDILFELGLDLCDECKVR